MNFFTFTLAHVQAQGSKKVQNKWCQDIVVIRFLGCACFPVDKTPTKEANFFRQMYGISMETKWLMSQKFIYMGDVRNHCTQTKANILAFLWILYWWVSRIQYEINTNLTNWNFYSSINMTFKKISRLHLNRYCPLFCVNKQSIINCQPSIFARWGFIWNEKENLRS